MQEPVQKQRGKLLTALLVLSALSLLFTLGTLFIPEFYTAAYPDAPSWFMGYMLVATLVGMIYVYGLWMMKKWGVYLLIVSTVLNPIATLLTLGVDVALFSIISALFGGVLWGIAIYRKWAYFD